MARSVCSNSLSSSTGNRLARVSGLPRRVDDDDPARRGLAAAALPPHDGNPSFTTIMKVAKALGLKLHFDSVA